MQKFLKICIANGNWGKKTRQINAKNIKSSPKVILQFLLTSQKNNKKAEKGDADAITIDSREGQIFWLFVARKWI